MKIEIEKQREIKGKLREVGDVVIVNKELGERLINEGIANRIVGDVENRSVVALDNRGHRRFSGHKIFGRR